MNDAEWQLAERGLKRIVNRAAKACLAQNLTLAEKLDLKRQLNEAREALRQHRLKRFTG